MSKESPFDIFLGTWSGTCSSFSREGELIGNWTFMVEYAWLDEAKTKFYFEQYIDAFYVQDDHQHWFGDDALFLEKSGGKTLEDYEQAHADHLKQNGLIKVQSVLDVEGEYGKRVEGWGVELDGDQRHWYRITGGESSVGIFVLMLRYPYGGVVYCNNTYFPNYTLRQTIGPTLADSNDLGGHCQITKGLVQTNNSQTYSRIATTALGMNTEQKKAEFLAKWNQAIAAKEAAEQQASASAKSAPVTPTRADMAQVYRHAWLDDQFREDLQNDPAQALQKFSDDNKLNWAVGSGETPTHMTGEEIKRIIEDNCDTSEPCPPPCCC